MKITNKDFKMYNRSYYNIINLDKSPVTKLLGDNFKSKLVNNSDGIQDIVSDFSDMEQDFSKIETYERVNRVTQKRGDVCIIANGF